MQIRELTGSRLVLITAIAIGGAAAASGCSDSTTVEALHGKLEVSCCMGVPDANKSLDTIDFGKVQVGIEQPMQLELHNGGNGTLTITSIELDSAFSASTYEFKLGESSLALNPSQTHNLTVTFQPYAEMQQPVTSFFRIVTDIKQDGMSSQVVTYTVNVLGQGVRSGLLVEPNPVEFGNVLIGSTRTLDVKVTNTLAVPVDVTTRLGSDGKPEIVNQGGLGRFEMVSPVTATGSILMPNTDGTPNLLAPNASTMVQLKYTPDPGQEGREDHGRWTLSNCANPLCDLDVVVKGTGTNEAIQCTPPNIEFGDVNPGTVLTKRTTCSNVASEEVTVTGWDLGPGSASEYQVTPYNGVPSRLGPGVTFDVEVQFSPTLASVGRNPAGSVYISGRNPRANRDLSQTRIGLTGDAGGPNIAVTPSQFNFGQVAIGTSSHKRLLVQNTGYSALTIMNVEGDAMHTGAFSTDFAPGSSLAIQPGDSHIFEVAFTPLTTGVLMSELIITSDDADQHDLHVMVQGEGVNLPPCAYTLAPTDINFGIVQVTHATTQGFRIENIGANDCLVNDVQIAPGSSGAFNLINGEETGVIIPAGMTKSVIVGYTPQREGADTGAVTFYISDPNNPNVTLNLRGVGSASALLISPNELDFGLIGVDCSTRDRTITVFNTGANNTRVVRIERPAGVSSEFQLDHIPAGIPSPPGAGALIAPGQSIEFTVRYHASDVGIDTGFIHLFEAGRTDPYVIPLYGEGAIDPTNEDHFTQLETPEVDILFVIDNSCSMADNQANLASNFPSFIQFADSQGLDYHIAVATTDVDDVTTFGNCPNPLQATRPIGMPQGACGYFADGNGDNTQTDPNWRIISPDEQPDPDSAFANLVTQGTNGSGTEQGLQAAYQSLSSPLITGWNSNFLRPSAYLALIIVSDADDQAPPTTDFFVNFFLAIKGFRNTNLFSMSAISQLPTDGCGEGGGSPRYQEVAGRTGGIFESICTNDWGQALQNLGLSVFGYKSRFFLSNTPVAGTVEVDVDGVKVDPTAPSGQVRWSYDPQTNSVNFAPLAIPEPGSEIVVKYTAECL